MIDTLTKYGDSGFMRDMEYFKSKSLGLRIRKSEPKKIEVDQSGWGWYEENITVQVFEDGELSHCNHAGHEPGIFFIDDELRGRGELCDKCEAWSYDGKEWHS